MKPSREEVLKIAREIDSTALTKAEFVQLFFAAAYAKGAEDMRERAVKECTDLADGWHGVNSDGLSPYGDYKEDACSDCAVAIRALPITPNQGDQDA